MGKKENQKYKVSPFVESIRIRAKYCLEEEIGVIFGRHQISWKDFYSRICKLANAFRALGIKKQEKIAFIFHNNQNF